MANIERLRKLEEHLRNGVLGHEVFDFSVYNSSSDYNLCGTNGCAIGECPIVFPQDWKFNIFGGVELIGSRESESNCAMFFFEINSHEFMHLFIPRGQDTKKYGGILLSSGATKEQVADNINKFINNG